MSTHSGTGGQKVGANAKANGTGDAAGNDMIYISFGHAPGQQQEFPISLRDCIPCRCTQPSGNTASQAAGPSSSSVDTKKKTKLRLEDCFGEWGSPPIEDELISSFDVIVETTIPRSWIWSNYPELCNFLKESEDSFLHHSANAGTNESKQFNTDLTKRLITLADDLGYEFECLNDDQSEAEPFGVKESPGFKAIRSRIRSFFHRRKEKKSVVTEDQSRSSSPISQKSDEASRPSITEATVETAASVVTAASRKSKRNRRSTDPSNYLQETSSCTARGCSQPHLNSNWNPISPEKRKARGKAGKKDSAGTEGVVGSETGEKTTTTAQAKEAQPLTFSPIVTSKATKKPSAKDQALRQVYQSCINHPNGAIDPQVLAKAVEVTGYREEFIVDLARGVRERTLKKQRQQFQPPRPPQPSRPYYNRPVPPPPPPPM